MGTRNLTIVRLDGEVKVAQYGQWDGYPTGQGVTVAEFLHGEVDLPKLKDAIKRLTWISNQELQARWKEFGADDSGFVSVANGNKFTQRYPWLSRDTGAGILKLVQDGGVDTVEDALDFLKDSACEFAYDINLDDETVTVWVEGKRHITMLFEDFTVEAMKQLEKGLWQ